MRCLLLLLMLSACATSSPGMMGGTRQAVTVEGVDFVVFRKADRVEIVRMGYLSRPQRDRVPALMVEAGERITGCRVLADSIRTRLPSDTGVAQFDLVC